MEYVKHLVSCVIEVEQRVGRTQVICYKFYEDARNARIALLVGKVERIR